jgi:hypothetical protein
MAKRATSLHPHLKSKHSRKTKKRLAAKKVMLAEKGCSCKGKCKC